MRNWQVHAFGDPEEMTFGEAPSPEPGQGEVRVRVHAAALNFFDLLLIQGKYQAKPGFPFTPGAEAAGVIDAIGDGVSGFAQGERVIALPSFGAFAEELICPASRLLRIPGGMDFETAAAYPIVYQTSWFALQERAKLQAGEWLLVHAGASGVGMTAIQLGKASGARVIATASRQEKLDFCRRQGADEALLYNDPAWVDDVKRITGHGADVVYDPVGGDVFDLSTKCTAPGGRILVIGFTSGRIPSIAANRLLLKNISVVGAIWGNWTAAHPAYIHQTHTQLMELWREGKIRPAIGRVYKLKEAPQALRDLGNRTAMGKSVLRIN
ncbi:MAG: NADPH:quinone oxidoreductase family protein [Bryobacterales bacterium]|nr:NADPH:quinone oxidoreductase family protein [Bryobacterales bacterium]